MTQEPEPQRRAAGSIAAALLLLLVAPARAEGPTIDWVGLKLGAAGAFWHNTPVEDPPAVQPVADLDLFTLVWTSGYLTPAEAYLVPFYGALGGGVAGGYRWDFGHAQPYELRVGTSVGLALVIPDAQNGALTVPVTPHTEFLYRTTNSRVGVGLGTSIHLRAKGPSAGEPILTTLRVYFIWHLAPPP